MSTKWHRECVKLQEDEANAVASDVSQKPCVLHRLDGQCLNAQLCRGMLVTGDKAAAVQGQAAVLSP